MSSPAKTFHDKVDAADGAIDLSALGMNTFQPYNYERNSLWILLPAVVLAITLLHLKKIRAVKKHPTRKGT